MITGSTSCYPTVSQGMQIYNMTTDHQDVLPSSLEASTSSDTHSSSLLYSLSILKDKVLQVQSLVSILISPVQSQTESTSIAIANMGTLIQEIIVTASSMMFNCQQLSLGATSGNPNTDELHQQRVKAPGNGLPEPNFGVQEKGQGFYSSENFDWYGDNYNNCNDSDDNNRSMHVSSNNTNKVERRELTQGGDNIVEGSQRVSPRNNDIIELVAADLLAKYTHYCHVCGKGFKRDANLRMHMRAHGDEYKTTAALTNPMKNNNASEMGNKDGSTTKLARKYSCPQLGCRWNQKHAKFQPLKSMICAKNHYKRSHCPKMYICKRCNQKQFSVLSDLRTHEKHCGDLKWQCSCGTTFSRKDKLMGHVALFVGHTPAITSLTKPGRVEHQATQMKLDDRR